MNDRINGLPSSSVCAMPFFVSTQLAVNIVAIGAPDAYDHSPLMMYPSCVSSAVPVAAPLPARHAWSLANISSESLFGRKPTNHPAPLHNVTTHAVLPSAQAMASSVFKTSGNVKPNPPSCCGTNISNSFDLY